MLWTMTDLKSALVPGPRGHLALVGGGGKTSLLFALAEECSRSGCRVVTSTTTKVWHHQAREAPRVLLRYGDPTWKENLKNGLEETGHVFLAEGLLDSGKVRGISPALADELYVEGDGDYLLLEADGAAGHPVKAHAAHEPVIPASVTMVVAVLGLEALGRPFSAEMVFREDFFREITGCVPGERLSAPILAGLFSHPRGLFKGTPNSAARIVFLNQCDLLEDLNEARELARRILLQTQGSILRVMIGSVKTGRYFVTQE